MAEEAPAIIVAVCTVTGTQGCAIVDRFKSLNKRRQQEGLPIVQVRGLTRDGTSIKAKALLDDDSHSFLTLVNVNYASPKSLRKALTGATGLYLNCTILMNHAKLYEPMIDAAIRVGVKHIVYSGSVEVEQKKPQHDQHHAIAHWDAARHTESYLAIRQDEESRTRPFKYHTLRYAHINETLQSPDHQHYHQDPVEEGWIAYSWQPSVRIHTASAKDGARVACKLFCDPKSLRNGAAMNIVTDYRNPHEIAQFLTLATGKPIQAYKGPAKLLLTTGSLIGSYENQFMVTMGEYVEQHWTKDSVKSLKNTIEKYLADEIKEEPLETVEAFVNRIYAGTDTAANDAGGGNVTGGPGDVK